jgi:hypothetical protein
MMLAVLLLFLLAVALKCAALVRRATGASDALSAVAGMGAAFAFCGLCYPILLFMGAPPMVMGAVLLAAAVGAVAWAWPERVALASRWRPGWRCDAWDALLAAGGLLFVWRFIGHSYRWGGFDGWAQWNMHARFLVGEGDWRALLETRFAHPDYPLMQPALIAAGWRALGTIDALVPMLLSALVAAGLLVGLHAAVRSVTGKALAAAAVLLCCIDPAFARCAASQYADTLLAFWLLLAMAFLLRAQAASRIDPLLAGFFAACAAWTKNEGIACFVAIGAAALIALRGHRGGLPRFLLGALPPLAVLLWFKLRFAPPSDLAGPAGIAWASVLDPNRHALVLATGAGYLLREAGMFLPVLTVLLAVGWGRRARAATFAALLMLAADYLIYLITPYDPVWHITHSADRLAHQVLPVMLVALALSDRWRGADALVRPRALR